MAGQFVEQSMSLFLQIQCPAVSPWRNCVNFRSKTWNEEPSMGFLSHWSEGKVMDRDIPKSL